MVVGKTGQDPFRLQAPVAPAARLEWETSVAVRMTLGLEAPPQSEEPPSEKPPVKFFSPASLPERSSYSQPSFFFEACRFSSALVNQLILSQSSALSGFLRAEDGDPLDPVSNITASYIVALLNTMATGGVILAGNGLKLGKFKLKLWDYHPDPRSVMLTNELMALFYKGEALYANGQFPEGISSKGKIELTKGVFNSKLGADAVTRAGTTIASRSGNISSLSALDFGIFGIQAVNRVLDSMLMGSNLSRLAVSAAGLALYDATLEVSPQFKSAGIDGLSLGHVARHYSGDPTTRLMLSGLSLAQAMTPTAVALLHPEFSQLPIGVKADIGVYSGVNALALGFRLFSNVETSQLIAMVKTSTDAWAGRSGFDAYLGDDGELTPWSTLERHEKLRLSISHLSVGMNAIGIGQMLAAKEYAWLGVLPLAFDMGVGIFADGQRSAGVTRGFGYGIGFAATKCTQWLKEKAAKKAAKQERASLTIDNVGFTIGPKRESMTVSLQGSF